jgi:hypothetical protein
MTFFGSGSYFSVGSNPSTRKFRNILNIIFLFILPSCKCFSLHIMTRCKLCMEIFFKGIYISIVHFC